MPFVLPAALKDKGCRKPRKDCAYTPAERAILAIFKDEYRTLTTHEERDQFLRGKVLVEMFNYWYSQEGVIPSEQVSKKRIEVLCLEL